MHSKQNRPKKKWIILLLLLIVAGLVIGVVEICQRQAYERALDRIGAGKIRRQKSYTWDGVDRYAIRDGDRYFRFFLSDKQMMEAVLKKDGWHPLPVDERLLGEIDGILGGMVYGNYIGETDRGELLAALGKISGGGWFFQDKNDVESVKNMDLAWTFHNGRRLTDFVVAVYDSGAGIIYYFESDL